MHILHISHDFTGSKVHGNLYKALANEGLVQTVYTYYDNEKYEGRNRFETDDTRIIYSKALGKYDRYLYHYKIYKIYRDIKKKVDAKSVNIIHATTLFSDGGAAYLLHQKYGTPYVVSVRNTDINLFLRRMHHTWPVCRRILLNAGRIVFISAAHRQRFEEHEYIKTFIDKIAHKILIIPNGIDDFWVDNADKNRSIGCENHGLIYVGVYDNNKNVLALIEAVKSLKPKYPDIRLTLVGGKGDLKETVQQVAKENHDCIDYKGMVTDKRILLQLYRENSVFAMPSHTETFGLVYLEAMSQRLACIYTKGQGIDGMYSEKVGIGVNSRSTTDIANAIERLFSHRSHFNVNEVDFETYRWSAIAKKYCLIYITILNNSL